MTDEPNQILVLEKELEELEEENRRIRKTLFALDEIRMPQPGEDAGQLWLKMKAIIRGTWVPPKDRDYNDGHTHEALHTTSVVMDTFERNVMETRTAQEFPDVAEAAEKAHQAMFDLYQLIGQKWGEEEEK